MTRKSASGGTASSDTQISLAPDLSDGQPVIAIFQDPKTKFDVAGKLAGRDIASDLHSKKTAEGANPDKSCLYHRFACLILFHLYLRVLQTNSIGQIMLNTPSALFATGLYSGSISMFIFLLTLYVLLALYLQYKADMVRPLIRAGTWWDEDGRHKKVVQYFEVFKHFVGPWGFWSTLVVVVIALLGVCQVQIIACATDMYYIDKSRSKREWSLIFGGVMVFTMLALPRFNKFRLLNIIGLIGTGMTAIYIIVDSSYHGFDIEHING
eukprot:gene4352-14471_t